MLRRSNPHEDQGVAVDLDLNLYRREVTVVDGEPPVRLSAIDVAPQAIQRTLVFLHGFGGHALQWAPQLQALAAENRVIAIDLRGHGLSDCPAGPYDVNTLVTDIERALRALDVERPFVLLGHSFGGALAALYAYRHPQDVERLVLVATAARLRLHRGLEWVFRLPAPFLERVRRVLKRHFFAPARVLKSMYFEAMCRWDGDQVFPALDQPALVIQGHRDIVFPKGDYRRVARLLPHAEEVIVPVSAHLVQLERADAVTRAIRRFLTPVPLSWRDATSHTAPLTAERPWVRFYDPGVPATIVVPDQPLHRFLDGAVRRFARRPALRFEGRTISYKAFEERVNRCANALLGLGVQQGDRVALLLPNVPQFAIACFGAWRAAAVIVPVDPRLPDDEVHRLLEMADARVLVALDDQAERAADLWPLRRTGDRVLVLTGRGDEVGRMGWRGHHRLDEVDNVIRWHEWLSAAGYARPRLRIAPDELAAILLTGGTTAPPPEE
ncbi:MAG: alpha/beta fold hydrolase [Ardenticatenia bacterium]|nr:alpha/beta fold hydrolase [Ardenticatenia bacterium]